MGNLDLGGVSLKVRESPKFIGFNIWTPQISEPNINPPDACQDIPLRTFTFKISAGVEDLLFNMLFINYHNPPHTHTHTHKQ